MSDSYWMTFSKKVDEILKNPDTQQRLHSHWVNLFLTNNYSKNDHINHRVVVSKTQFVFCLNMFLVLLIKLVTKCLKKKIIIDAWSL